MRVILNYALNPLIFALQYRVDWAGFEPCGKGFIYFNIIFKLIKLLINIINLSQKDYSHYSLFLQHIQWALSLFYNFKGINHSFYSWQVT